MRF
ncbi:hypothetical protein D030_2145A, partial [Vibrio parahaemolyticus AQ3810]|jgi:hypothetical protein